MVLLIFLILLAILISFLVFRKITEEKKYQNKTYLDNIQRVDEFLGVVRSFDDYVTWVQRDRLLAKYSDIGRYLKNKNKFYKKEEKVLEFNTIYNDFENYIIAFNKEYIQAQKEFLKDYFDDIIKSENKYSLS